MEHMTTKTEVTIAPVSQDILRDVKAIFFDLDGTLVDSMWIWRQIDIDYLARFGIRFPEEGLQGAIDGMSFSETAVWFKEHFQLPDSLDQIKADWNQMSMEKYRTEVPLKKGAREFLEHCMQHGIRLGIATSNSRELVDTVIHALGVEPYFSCILTSCEVGRGKPAPDIYLACAEAVQVSPEACLVFEDIVTGIQAGKAAGMKVCAVEDEAASHQRDVKRELADFFIEDFTDFRLYQGR